MISNKISGVPVVERDDIVVGIITETDLLIELRNLLGAIDPGWRIVMRVPDRDGEFRKLIRVISENGWGIMALGSVRTPKRARPLGSDREDSPLPREGWWRPWRPSRIRRLWTCGRRWQALCALRAEAQADRAHHENHSAGAGVAHGHAHRPLKHAHFGDGIGHLDAVALRVKFGPGAKPAE